MVFAGPFSTNLARMSLGIYLSGQLFCFGFSSMSSLTVKVLTIRCLVIGLMQREH
jgi:hypothetical protein